MTSKKTKTNKKAKKFAAKFLKNVEGKELNTSSSLLTSKSDLKSSSIKDISQETQSLSQEDPNQRFVKEIEIKYWERDEVNSVNQKGEKKPKFDWQLYKKLLNYVKKELFLLFVIYSSLLISTITETFIPYMVGQLLNEVTKTGGETNIQSTILIFVGLISTTCVFGYIRIVGYNLLGQRVMLNLKHDIFSQFLGNDLVFFEKHKTGDLMSRLGRDVATARVAVGFNSAMLLRNLMLCISNIVMLFYLSWRVSLSILPIIPAYYLIAKYFSFKNKQIEKKVGDINAASSEVAEEVFSGIMTVKAFGQENYEKKRYDTILRDESTQNRIYGYFNAGFFTINNVILANIVIFIVLWYGGYLVTTASEEGLSSGNLASFILYSTQFAETSSALSYGINAIVSATGALERIFKMMSYDPAIKNTTGKEIKIIQGIVKFEQVSFSYPGKQIVQVLHGIDFEIKSGECVAFVGTSGSGKSTVVKLIERFYDTTSGQVLLDGHNVKEIKGSSIREHVSIVSQEPILFSGSILDNIVYGIESYTLNEVDLVCDMSGVSQFMKNPSLFPLGYQTIVGERGTKLSGGQKQRVAIARALIKKPQILIFDEATSALDSESEYQVQQSIDSLIKNRTMTIIVIAHRLSTIKNCSKIFVMQQGKIVEQGTHSDLIALEGVYKQLVERQLSQKI